MGGQKKHWATLEPLRGSQGLHTHGESRDEPTSLTPIVIVVYLVVYWLWICLGPRQWRFFEEPYNCTFLLVLSLYLWRKGKCSEIKKYFIGRVLPMPRDFAKATLIVLLLAAWTMLTNLLYWQWVGGVPKPVDPLEQLRWFLTWPVTEEVVCRGVILAILLKYTESGRWIALLVSALLFAGLHVAQDVFYIIQLFGAGVLLGYGYMATQSVPYCILCHSIANGIMHLAAHLANRSA